MIRLIPEEVILKQIYLIRGVKVMLDMDLATLYRVETKQLKRAVRRNIVRFPADFMFELSKEELEIWRRQFGTSNAIKMGLRIPPFAFTEHGILMLSSVLNSDIAVETGIRIIRIFNKLHEIIRNYQELWAEVEQMKAGLKHHDDKLLLIFEYLKQLEEKTENRIIQESRNPIGFRAVHLQNENNECATESQG
jgi:hypothetical protein